MRVPPSGTWHQRRADLYGLAEQLIVRSSATEAEGLVHLVHRYLGGFGPATPGEIAGWAGVAVAAIPPAVDRIPLRRLRSEDGTVLVDLRRAPPPDLATPAAVRFLPSWRPALLIRHRR